jgi:hypothetical protein
MARSCECGNEPSGSITGGGGVTNSATNSCSRMNCYSQLVT